MSSLCEKISDAKCCIVDTAEKYVKNVSKGNYIESDFFELILLNGYINSLERYDDSETKILLQTIELNHNQNTLLCNGKKLILNNSCKVDVNPDDVNCLCKDQICFILEQLSLKCDSCNCNC